MRLLVSVRSALEVLPALEGGADIIDAKEPANGSLGPVTPRTLAAIARRVPEGRGLSVALGDITASVQIRDGIQRSTAAVARAAETFVKLGLAGVTSPGRVASLLTEAVKLTGGTPWVRVIPVAYADHARAGSLPPVEVAGIASEAGAAGVLLDTFTKDGGDLLSWLSPPELVSWVEQVRSRRLLAGLAGSLQGPSFEAACSAQPDVVGVRGAACLGGRSGRVDRDSVRALRELMRQQTAVSSEK
jgi:(5-formylfuran-3-yl)methyl phosphate synthase